MATLTVWKFETGGGNGRGRAPPTARADTEGRADRDRRRCLRELAGRAKKPKTEQLRNMTGAGALGGSFWGLLFGLIFFIPLLGMAMGAALGALSGSMADVGIDDSFIKNWCGTR